MEELSSNGRETEKKQRIRFMGKLFKESKKPTSEVEVENFLHGTTDKFLMLQNTSNLPSKAQFDNIHTQKSPCKLEISSSPIKNIPVTPKPGRKGLIVHFNDSKPELIGEGGELSEDPTINVSLRKMARLNSSNLSIKEYCVFDNQASYSSRCGTSPALDSTENYHPVSSREINQQIETNKRDINVGEGNRHLSHPGGENLLGRSRDIFQGDKSNSFTEKVKNEMRSGEGRTLVASRNSIAQGDLSQGLSIEEASYQLEELQLNTMNNAIRSNSTHLLNSVQPHTNEDPIERSDSISMPKECSASHQRLHNNFNSTGIGISDTILPNISDNANSKNPPASCLEAATSIGEEALAEFAKRTDHMSTLFRLSTEATKPVTICTPEQLVRAGIWWFLKGRMNLEAAVWERAAISQAQTTDSPNLSQIYMDLAKALWVLDILASRSTGAELRLVDKSISSDTSEARKSLICSMKKLAMSMRRNNFFPSNTYDSIFIQKLDPTFWNYEDGDKSMIVGQRLLSIPSLSESLPLGDSTNLFHYGRIFAEAVLTEEGAPQRYRCQVLLSIIRYQKEKSIQAIITNQEGTLNFAIQSDKTKGPTWEDLKWHKKKSMIEVCLPRGFFLCLHCSDSDFGNIWRHFDYQKRVYSIMTQRAGEEFAYETILKNFQYIDEGHHPTFTKEPQPCCHMRLYEKVLTIKAAGGSRKVHRGFRITIVTNPSTKNLGGLELDLLPNFPIEFSYLRGDGELPALLLKVEARTSKCMLIATFKEITERNRFHAVLTGRALGPDEVVIAKGNVKNLKLSTADQKFISLPESLDWQGFIFINQQQSDLQCCKTILSERLRMIIEFRYGTMTDRINVGPGELKYRVDPRHPCVIQILRQPQMDWTTLIESKAPKGSPQELEGLLNILKESDSTRAYTFSSMAELHLFQLALTGFEVLFDDVVTTFNISRRRMVVPIYKKWDASMPRIQIVKKEKVIQLVVFFENFSHGDCMSFALRSTDIFESSSRGGKYLLRVVDAKFALPKTKADGCEIDHEFISLDLPEYPGEHDDISIHFENENGMRCSPFLSSPH